jgi:hypothetical protein
VLIFSLEPTVINYHRLLHTSHHHGEFASSTDASRLTHLLPSFLLGSNTPTEESKRKICEARGRKERKAADGCQEEHKTKVSGIHWMDRSAKHLP